MRPNQTDSETLKDRFFDLAENGDWFAVIRMTQENMGRLDSKLYEMVALTKLGRFDEAFNKGKKYQPSMSDASFEQNYIYYGTMSHIFSFRGDSVRAIEYSQHSLQQAEKLEIPRRISSALNNLGEEYLTFGEYETAIDYLEKSLRISEQENIEFGIIYTNYNLARAYSLTNDHPMLKICLLNLQDRIPEKNSFQHVLYQMVEVFVLKSSSRAKDKLAALIILEDLQNSDLEAEIQIEIAKQLIDLKIYELRLTGQNDVFEEILQEISLMDQMALNQGMFPLLIRSHLFRAKLFFVEGHLDLATQIMDKAKKIAMTHELVKLEAVVDFELANLLTEIDRMQELVNRNATYLAKLDKIGLIEYAKSVKNAMEEFTPSGSI